MNKQKTGTRILLCLTVMLFTSSAFAYIPPSNFIIKNIAAKHAILKSGVRVKTEVSSQIAGKSEVKFKAVLLFDPNSRTLRAWATDANDRKIYQLERKTDTFTLADILAFESRAGSIERSLKAAGVPVKTEEELLELPDETQRQQAELLSLSLKRYRGTQCWVIGRENEGDSALWIEKDSFFPLKLVLSKNADSNIAEVQLDSYRFQNGFAFVTGLTLVGRENTPLLREQTHDLIIGSVSNEYKAPVTSGFTEEGATAGDDVKELVNQYFKYVR